MKFTPTAPSLADMGWALWGPTWADALSESFEVAKDQIATWETDPTSRPTDLEAMLDDLCEVRIQEIQLMQAQLKETGLGRADVAESTDPGKPEHSS